MAQRAAGRDQAVVRQSLQHYANLGTFRSFAEAEPCGRAAVFRFVWFRELSFTVTFAPQARRLVFQNLLPGVPARSAMDRDLRGFLKERYSRELPEHRRIEVRKLGVRALNRRGSISLVFTMKGDHAAYGVRKAVNLVHEIFTIFLNEGRYAQYQVEHLRLNPEMA
jgi:hypothetical protein